MRHSYATSAGIYKYKWKLWPLFYTGYLGVWNSLKSEPLILWTYRDMEYEKGITVYVGGGITCVMLKKNKNY
jgi:hypothetical protein